MYFAVYGGTGRVCFFFEAGRGGGFFFPRRDGAVVSFFRGGTGRLFFFPRRDGVAFFFFFDGTGRGGVFFLFERRDGTVVLGGGNFFRGTGQNRYTVPPNAVLDHSRSHKIEKKTKKWIWSIFVK